MAIDLEKLNEDVCEVDQCNIQRDAKPGEAWVSNYTIQCDVLLALIARCREAEDAARIAKGDASSYRDALHHRDYESAEDVEERDKAFIRNAAYKKAAKVAKGMTGARPREIAAAILKLMETPGECLSDAEKFLAKLAKKWPGRDIEVSEIATISGSQRARSFCVVMLWSGMYGGRMLPLRKELHAPTLPELRAKVAAAMEADAS